MGRVTLTKVRDGSGGHPKGLGGPFGDSEGVRKPSRRSGTGWEAFPEVQEALPEIWDGSGGPTKFL